MQGSPFERLEYEPTNRVCFAWAEPASFVRRADVRVGPKARFWAAVLISLCVAIPVAGNVFEILYKRFGGTAGAALTLLIWLAVMGLGLAVAPLLRILIKLARAIRPPRVELRERSLRWTDHNRDVSVRYDDIRRLTLADAGRGVTRLQFEFQHAGRPAAFDFGIPANMPVDEVREFLALHMRVPVPPVVPAPPPRGNPR